MPSQQPSRLMTAPTGIRSRHIQQAAEVKFLKAQGWTLQAIQAAFPEAEYSTLYRTFSGRNNKGVAPVRPGWFTTEENK